MNERGVARYAIPSWAPWALVGLITLAALILRLLQLDRPFLGDELSTVYLVDGRGLSDVVSRISSDAEISPPLFFVLSWLSSHLGSAPEWIRLPSLLAGVASVPLAYVVGSRLVRPSAGVVAAAVMAFNPFMLFYSIDARAYAVAIFLLLATTWALTAALRDGRTRWWVAYGLLTALAMYTHYTAAFVLAAQLAWALVVYRDRWKPLLAANAGAALVFVPWLPSMLKDVDSPTTPILEALQGDGFDVKFEAVKTWLMGYPGPDLDEIPGYFVQWAIPAGLAIALAAAAFHWWQRRSRAEPTAERIDDEGRAPIRHGVALAVALAIATPVAELLLLALGTDLFGARNLNTSSGGVALAIGALLSSAGAIWGSLAGLLVIGGFLVGSVKALDRDVSSINLDEAAHFIDERAGPEDVVVDSVSAGVTPVPTTSMGLYLDPALRHYKLGLAEGEPPFLAETSSVPDPARLMREAFAEAEGLHAKIFLVAVPTRVETGAAAPSLSVEENSNPVSVILRLPEGWSVEDREVIPGFADLNVLELEPTGDN